MNKIQPVWYAALESWLDGLKKERKRKGIQYDPFSGFHVGLSETRKLPVDFNEKLFHIAFFHIRDCFIYNSIILYIEESNTISCT